MNNEMEIGVTRSNVSVYGDAARECRRFASAMAHILRGDIGGDVMNEDKKQDGGKSTAAANGASMEFAPSVACTIGVELELQILNSRDYNLARDAADLIGLLEKSPLPGAVKPEITESMVELNSSIHAGH